MFIPFWYTSYKNSKLATVVSFFGSIFIVAGLLMGVTFVVETVGGGSGFDELVGGVAVCVIFAGLGWLLTRWAKRIAEKKLEKEMGTARRIEPHTTAAGSRSSMGTASSANVCSHCGNTLGPDDVFCYKCGTKRGS